MLGVALASSITVAAGSSAVYGTVGPRSCLWGRVVGRGLDKGKRVGLSFDDGPTPGPTETVLDILERFGVCATFFVIGENVERHPELLRRIVDAGHEIGNHTWEHCKHAWMGSRRYWEDEIRRADEVIERVVGFRPKYFRPPLGIKTFWTLEAARQLGHVTVNWSRRGLDGIKTNPEKILRRFGDVRAGDILLLHDGFPRHQVRDQSPTIAALPRLLERLEQRGLEVGTVGELLDHSATANAKCNV